MKLRATIPFHAYVNAEESADLSPSTDFRFKDLQVAVSFAGKDPLKLPGEPVHHLRRLNALVLEISGDNSLKVLAEGDDARPVLSLVVRIANRVLLAVRNFGTVAHVEPLRISAADSDRWLRALHVSVCEDHESWTPLRSTDSLEEVLADQFLLTRENVGELNARDWPAVQEAIQDDLKAGAEREFFTNSVEHLRVGNLRLAVVESVICLEIVLAEWLQHVLPLRGISSKKAKDLLRPQLDLSTRLNLLLPLLLPTPGLQTFNHDDVLRAVGFRNGVVHKTGNLPDNVGPDVVRHSVGAVLSLARRLAFDNDRMRRVPEMDRIAQGISSAHGIPLPKIQFIYEHEYTAGVDFPEGAEIPTDEKLTAIATELTAKVAAYDPRFHPAGPPWLVFKQAGEPIAVWLDGQLRKTVRKPRPSILEIIGLLQPPEDNAPEK